MESTSGCLPCGDAGAMAWTDELVAATEVALQETYAVRLPPSESADEGT
jgi:hypothetical protein